jgi:tetratricopeptide (TPR) repeat protein
LNVEAYPESGNVYDSLAEAYLKEGNKEMAIKFYLKSLEKDPNNENARGMLRRLGVKKDNV